MGIHETDESISFFSIAVIISIYLGHYNVSLYNDVQYVSYSSDSTQKNLDALNVLNDSSSLVASSINKAVHLIFLSHLSVCLPVIFAVH